MLLDDSIRKNLTIILVGDEAAEQLGDSEARSFSDHSTQTARTFWRDILIRRIPFFYLYSYTSSCRFHRKFSMFLMCTPLNQTD